MLAAQDLGRPQPLRPASEDLFQNFPPMKLQQQWSKDSQPIGQRTLTEVAEWKGGPKPEYTKL